LASAKEPRASLVEAFFSFQGEGPHVGEATVFVRTAACPIRCHYCDTEYAFRAPQRAQLRDFEGQEFGSIPNPCSASQILGGLPGKELGLVRWLSLTGGEPLLFPDFGLSLFREARSRALRTHLETAALDPEALEILLPETDHLSMDWKLPSTLAHGDPRESHLACLRLAVARKVDVTVKIVLPAGDFRLEWQESLDALAPLRDAFSLVLQPLSPVREGLLAPSREKLIRAAGQCLEQGFRLRVLPQVHRLLGLD